MGAAGFLTRIDGHDDRNCNLPDQATSSLPVIGGRSKSRVKAPFWQIFPGKQSLYVGSTSAWANGGPVEVDRKWKTEVCAEAHDIHLLKDKITVASVAAHVSSEFQLDPPLAQFSLEGCWIAGLKLDGAPVNVKVKALGPEGMRAMVHGQSEADRRRVVELGIIDSVEFPEGMPPGVSYDPAIRNRILWEDVGAIYLGELLVSGFSRRLTMLRIEFGCPNKGGFCAPDVQDEGHTVP
ncbi:MAG: hypothetical protein HY822_17720 [Acidobacteria bacterium]|nr:hypothetical protein [Acidobacteriota bacterium]